MLLLEGVPYRSWFVDVVGLQAAVAVSNVAQVGAMGILGYIIIERYGPKVGLKVPSV